MRMKSIREITYFSYTISELPAPHCLLSRPTSLARARSRIYIYMCVCVYIDKKKECSRRKGCGKMEGVEEDEEKRRKKGG